MVQTVTHPPLRLVQRRVILSLIGVQAVFSLVFAMTGPLISLIADDVTGSAGQAGLAQAMIPCGGVLFSVPLAVLSIARGRRVGIAAGYLAGAVGAGGTVLGAVVSSYPLILAGALGLGAALAAGFQARFAATDLAESDRLGRSMGVLSWSSIVAAVVGPSLVGAFDGLGGGRLPTFSGPYLAIAVGLAVSGVLVLVFLRPDPLLLARSLDKERERERPPLREAAAAVWRHPPARRSMVVLMTVHAAMISLMNMASIHLHHGAASLAAIGVAISVHTAAMYLFGPLAGYLTDRLGAQPVLVAGLSSQVAAAITVALAPAGDTVFVTAGLLLLGVGWSGGYLAGSVMLTAATDGHLRTLAQGLSDFLVQLTSAGGALLAGVVVAVLGYATLATTWGVVVLMLLVTVVVTPVGNTKKG